MIIILNINIISNPKLCILSDKKIFHTILEYNPIYIEKIFYFSIHNLININPNTDIKGVPIIKNNTDIDNIKKVLEEHIKKCFNVFKKYYFIFLIFVHYCDMV